MARPRKIIRLSYWKEQSADEPLIMLLGNPGELRFSAGKKSFVSLKEGNVSISGGMPSTINIQGLSTSMKYAGMIQDLPFPLSIMPTTPYNPFPKQIINPPMKDLLPMIKDLSSLAQSLVS